MLLQWNFFLAWLSPQWFENRSILFVAAFVRCYYWSSWLWFSFELCTDCCLEKQMYYSLTLQAILKLRAVQSKTTFRTNKRKSMTKNLWQEKIGAFFIKRGWKQLNPSWNRTCVTERSVWAFCELSRFVLTLILLIAMVLAFIEAYYCGTFFEDNASKYSSWFLVQV